MNIPPFHSFPERRRKKQIFEEDSTLKNNRGFTLAELLIVVAIIAVLVAIAIPIFTSQLEKSREATDLSNIRAAYAEVTTAILTGDVANSKVSNNLSISGTVNENDDFVLSVANFPIQQKQDDWQTANPQIAGVAINSTSFTAVATTTLYLKFTHADDGDIILSSWSIETALT